MKLQEALLKLKNLKSRLVKTQAAVVASIVHYEDETPEFNYVEEFNNNVALEEEVLELKSNIQQTNVRTLTSQGVSLAELILVNADLRAKIAFTNKLLEQTVTFEGGRLYGNNKTKDSVNKRYAEGYNKKNLRLAVQQLETTKENVEAQIARLNMTTDLIITHVRGGEPVSPEAKYIYATTEETMDHMNVGSITDHLENKE